MRIAATHQVGIVLLDAPLCQMSGGNARLMPENAGEPEWTGRSRPAGAAARRPGRAHPASTRLAASGW
jgi:hypothetical protein